MTFRLITVILLLTTFTSFAQLLPDSVIVTHNTYVNGFDGSDNIYRSENFSIVLEDGKYAFNGKKISKARIVELFKELTRADNIDNSLAKYELDTNWIINNPKALLALYSEKKMVDWNKQQVDFIFGELTDLANYKEELQEFISNGGSYGLHHNYKKQYSIKFYNRGEIYVQATSRKYVWGYKMPWTNLAGDTLYNFNIEKKLKNLLSTNEALKSPLKGKRLQRYLVNKIVDYNMPSLFKLSPYSHMNEINELSSDFDVVSFEEVYGRGRYIWNEPKVMKMILKNGLMHDNVSMVFLASKKGNRIYSRDSIKKDYASYINRVQSIKFISDYLKAYPNSRLDIYYFNNRGINEYNIKGVNNNPKGWARHDKWVGSLSWYQKNDIQPGFDIEQAVKTSERVDCGCNYRFQREYIEQAIFFEVFDVDNNSSIWFLLPDNKVLLYIMDGATALNFRRSDFGEKRERGITYPCAVFDITGNRLSR